MLWGWARSLTHLASAFFATLRLVECLREGHEPLNPMLDPLDGFLGLHSSKADFLDERLGLLRSAHHNRLAIRHCRTPATEGPLGSFP